MSVITLESSRVSSQSKSNSEWETNYSNTYLIEDGDVFSMKNAFIDSGKNDIQDIVLDTDTPIVLYLGYYMINYTGADKKQNDGTTNFTTINYKPYIPYFMSGHGGNTKYGSLAAVDIYFENDFSILDYFGSIYTYTFQFTAVDELGKVVNFPYTPPGTGKEPENLPGTADPNHPYAARFFLPTPIPNLEESSLVSLVPFVPPESLAGDVIVGAYYWTNEHSGAAPGADHPGTMVTGKFSVTVPSGSYSYENLAQFITDKMDSRLELNGDPQLITKNHFFRRSDENGDIKFVQVSPIGSPLPAPILPATADGTQKYMYSNGTNPVPYWFGSTQNSLQYNLDNQRDIYSWNYLHTPMKDDKGSTVTIDFKNGNNWYTINKTCGCFLLGAFPTDFWEDKLGFDLKTLIVTPEIVAAAKNCQIIRENMLVDGKTTTGQYLNLDGLTQLPDLGDLFITKINITSPNTIQSNDTYQINANDVNNKFSSGAYLIEVSGIPQTYMYGEDTNPNISGVVSKQYNSSALIVGFSDSSINYQHQGHPFTLQSLKIRILDIATKQPAELGPNSSLIFNIFKNPNPEPDEKQIEKKNK